MVREAGWDKTAQCTETLIKFLRARNWKLDASMKMISKRQEWISTFQPHKLDIEKDQIGPLISQGKCFLYGRDKYNRPIVIFKGGKHFPNKSQNETFFKFLVYIIENGKSLLPPPPYNQVLVLYDRLNFGMSNYDLNLFKKCQVLADYYPECLYKVHICRPNWVLKTVWAVCSAFVDPNVLKKIQLLEKLEDLSIDVEKHQLPMSLGGFGLLEPFPSLTPFDDDTPKDLLINDEKEELRNLYSEELEKTRLMFSQFK